ncbi:MAG: hypothetical protein ABI596_15325 [Pyrinomonadaceae bacterium]
MSLSRRKFLRAGTLVALAAGIPAKAVLAETLVVPNSPLPAYPNFRAALSLNREAFSRCLNTRFSFVHGEATPVAVKLIEVNDLTPNANRPSAEATGKECFAAVFIGSHNAPLRQETYTVTHESLGRFSMLVVPVASNKEGLYYEAVFNRLH